LKPKLLRNRAKCRDCGEVIESKYRWDFVRCGCGKIAVDGGLDYARRVFTDELPIDMCEYEGDEGEPQTLGKS